MTNPRLIDRLRGGLIVSCQALPGEPLFAAGGGVMPLFAMAAEQGGAVGIRCNSARDVLEIKAAVGLPVIGLIKHQYLPYEPYITATMTQVQALVAVGADIVAVDCTLRERVDKLSPAGFIAQIRAAFPNLVLMADVATLKEGLAAAESGVDFVGTTLSGYTPQSQGAPGPNFSLVEQLVARTAVPVIAEGRIRTPLQARQMIDLGAFCVVVGGAITRPLEITTDFVTALA
ncbi:N-acetylmannosamine-6-phosphate 2-epimerase [Cryobacterium sp. TMT1-62]|uniref:N-acetylmannosamine-6-phosphate 2-epimerase n=1 Tax=unclassified Cryobacterium TaxID=2649013 RepID=UPI00106BDA56|nr:MULTISPECIES: N-acetylmannosamine-6-phosphate 2-epimerase [unclassified Cryobacterium]TFB54262.1 N-acetylmannosamine-6-phosphate 2-epimerase [Cryobacterium sp. Sr3]TFB60678.1 N-acetylmannosamine-6-phosphate 2-epimerase [Cryobacterium sp. Hz7]TFC49019.1 N-acetylmannosamine-6-phosphate 2-epimerase [Cryobacterium sp. TMT2-17-1]TFD36337.1 N-acetylmannosamine-6-phosphate 2-epimerase [Cryobacterium sp. TMT1-62]